MEKNNNKAVSTTRGIKGGYAFCAPVGTEVPTDIVTPLDPAFKNVGYISSDGWKESLDSSSENIEDMNGDPVDNYTSSNTETLAMKLLEMDSEALSVQYGHENVTDADGILAVDHNWGKSEENLAWVLELVLKNGRRWRKVIKSAKRSDLGDFEGSSSSETGREVTLTYQTDENGSTAKDYFESLSTTAPAALSEKPLDDMTKDELIAYASAHGITVSQSGAKAEILQAIKDAEAAND